SLIGVPPLSGFWPKIYLFEAAFDTESYVFIGSLILASFITLFVITRLWAEVFWKDSTENEVVTDNFQSLKPFQKGLLVIPIGLLASASLFIGLNAEFIIQVTDRIADEMLDTRVYVEAVLGK